MTFSEACAKDGSAVIWDSTMNSSCSVPNSESVDERCGGEAQVLLDI